MSERVLVATGTLPEGASARGLVETIFSVPAENASWARADAGVVYSRPLATPWPERITDFEWTLHDADDRIVSSVLRPFSTDADLVSTNPLLGLPGGAGRLLVWPVRPGGYTAAWKRLFAAVPQSDEDFWLLYDPGRADPPLMLPAGLIVRQHFLLRADASAPPAEGYATPADLAAQFGASEIDELAAGADGPSRVAEALAAATAEMDSVLGRAYPLPLPATGARYPLLVAIACDLARLFLFAMSAPDVVLGRAASARKRLRELADGTRALVSADGVVIARSADGGAGAMATSAEPLFSRARLRGL